MNDFRTVGIALGQNVVHIVCMDEAVEIVKRHKCAQPHLF